MPRIKVKSVDVASAILTGFVFSVILFILGYFILFAIVVNTDIVNNNQHYLEFMDIRQFFLKGLLTGVLTFAFLGSLISAIIAFGYNLFSSHITGVKFEIEEVERKF